MSLNLLKQTQSEKKMYAALRSAKNANKVKTKDKQTSLFWNGQKTNRKPFKNIFVYNFKTICFMISKQNSTARQALWKVSPYNEMGGRGSQPPPKSSWKMICLSVE